MSKTERSTTNGSAPRKRAVTKEMSLSLFESALSYMLEAGWVVIAETRVSPSGLASTVLEIIEMGHRINEGKAEFYSVPMMVTADTNTGTL